MRSAARSSPAPATLPDNDDLLGEILLRLPPLPSSLPRASLVCRRWRRVLADRGFLRRFRAHHGTPPLLGYFVESFTESSFLPALRPPDRIPSARFSPPPPQPTGTGGSRTRRFLGCRHGLAALLDVARREAVVWEPVTGRERRVPFPPAVKSDRNRYVFNGAVLGAPGGGDSGFSFNHHLSCFTFRLVMLFNNGEEDLAFACVYESESGKWGRISSVAVPPGSPLFDHGVMVGNAVFWYLGRGGNILQFDLGTQSLSVIHRPEELNLTDWSKSSFRVLLTEDGGLGLAFVSMLSIQIWGRKADSEGGAAGWVLQRTVELDKLLSLTPSNGDTWITRVLGFDEESNDIFVMTARQIFIVHLKSMQFEKLEAASWIAEYHPYRSFYAAVGCGDDGAEILNNT